MDDTASGSDRPRPRNQDPVKLRNRRILAGLSLTTVAQRTGKSKGHMSEIESLKRFKSASPELLADLAGIYGCTIADLVSDEILHGIAA